MLAALQQALVWPSGPFRWRPQTVLGQPQRRPSYPGAPAATGTRSEGDTSAAAFLPSSSSSALFGGGGAEPAGPPGAAPVRTASDLQTAFPGVGSDVLAAALEVRPAWAGMHGSAAGSPVCCFTAWRRGRTGRRCCDNMAADKAAAAQPSQPCGQPTLCCAARLLPVQIHGGDPAEAASFLAALQMEVSEEGGLAGGAVASAAYPGGSPPAAAAAFPGAALPPQQQQLLHRPGAAAGPAARGGRQAGRGRGGGGGRAGGRGSQPRAHTGASDPLAVAERQAMSLHLSARNMYDKVGLGGGSGRVVNVWVGGWAGGWVGRWVGG